MPIRYIYHSGDSVALRFQNTRSKNFHSQPSIFQSDVLLACPRSPIVHKFSSPNRVHSGPNPMVAFQVSAACAPEWCAYTFRQVLAFYATAEFLIQMVLLRLLALMAECAWESHCQRLSFSQSEAGLDGIDCNFTRLYRKLATRLQFKSMLSVQPSLYNSDAFGHVFWSTKPIFCL